MDIGDVPPVRHREVCTAADLGEEPDVTVYDRVAAQASDSVTKVAWFGVTATVHAADAALHDYVASQHHLVETHVPADGVLFDAQIYACTNSPLLEEVYSAIHAGASYYREAFQGEWYRCGDLPGAVFAMVADRPNMSKHALLTRDFQSWAIVCQKADELGLAVTRAIRELVREDLLRRGAIMLHAAAARTADGRGLLLVGASGSGKTSAAVRIGQSGGLAVGTDRTALVPVGGEWLAVGMPMSIRLGQGSASALGVLHALGARSPIRAHNPFGTATRPEPTLGKEQKLSLSNAEVFELLGCGFAPATAIDTVLVFTNGAHETPKSTELASVETAAALREHTFMPDPDYRSRWLSADPTPETADGLPAELAAVAGRHHGLLVAWDPVLHCGDDTAEVLVPPRP
ncbi:hypothetical protein ACIBK9_28735 [Nonomuraea sp. NPDC050227]|uniref:hypothetical protein n=1 Tax=Nonomuraea sp. NPDC050227 TaxID=3364360 RepID=UPI0037B6FAB0